MSIKAEVGAVCWSGAVSCVLIHCSCKPESSDSDLDSNTKIKDQSVNRDLFKAIISELSWGKGKQGIHRFLSVKCHCSILPLWESQDCVCTKGSRNKSNHEKWGPDNTVAVGAIIC